MSRRRLIGTMERDLVSHWNKLKPWDGISSLLDSEKWTSVASLWSMWLQPEQSKTGYCNNLQSTQLHSLLKIYLLPTTISWKLNFRNFFFLFWVLGQNTPKKCLEVASGSAGGNMWCQKLNMIFHSQHALSPLNYPLLIMELSKGHFQFIAWY